MNYGLVLPVEGPGATREAICSAARRAEQLGFGSLWVTDRVLMPANRPAGYPYSADRGALAFDPLRNWLDPIVAMGMALAVTERVLIGTNVLVLPYRQPVVLAQEVASLDWLFGGRVLLGVGAGWMAEEFAALGVRRAERGALTDEYVEVLRKLWSAKGPVSHHGRRVDIEQMALAAAPARTGGPPVLVGGNSPAALRRVARLGDGWLGVDLTPTEAASFLAELRCRGGERRPVDEMVLSVRLRIDPSGDAGAPADPQALAEEVVSYEAAGVNLLIYDVNLQEDPNAAVDSLAARLFG